LALDQRAEVADRVRAVLEQRAHGHAHGRRSASTRTAGREGHRP
jgi:hypothetical protein